MINVMSLKDVMWFNRKSMTYLAESLNDLAKSLDDDR